MVHAPVTLGSSQLHLCIPIPPPPSWSLSPSLCIWRVDLAFKSTLSGNVALRPCKVASGWGHPGSCLDPGPQAPGYQEEGWGCLLLLCIRSQGRGTRCLLWTRHQTCEKLFYTMQTLQTPRGVVSLPQVPWGCWGRGTGWKGPCSSHRRK